MKYTGRVSMPVGSRREKTVKSDDLTLEVFRPKHERASVIVECIGEDEEIVVKVRRDVKVCVVYMD